MGRKRRRSLSGCPNCPKTDEEQQKLLLFTQGEETNAIGKTVIQYHPTSDEYVGGNVVYLRPSVGQAARFSTLGGTDEK